MQDTYSATGGQGNDKLKSLDGSNGVRGRITSYASKQKVL